MASAPAKSSASQSSSESSLYRRRSQVPQAHPLMRCACGHLADVWIAGTVKNRGRRFLKCFKQDSRNACGLWIWEDLLEDFVAKRLSEASEYYRNLADSFRSDLGQKDSILRAAAQELADLKSMSSRRVVICSVIFFFLGFFLAKIF